MTSTPSPGAASATVGPVEGAITASTRPALEGDEVGLDAAARGAARTAAKSATPNGRAWPRPRSRSQRLRMGAEPPSAPS